MFKINYEIQDGGPRYKCTYPKEEDYNHNIFFIRGTNDQGKTTTLNIVALGLYANESFSKDKGIVSDSLRSRIDYLTSDDLEYLDFDFEIKSVDNQTSIHSTYNNGNLITELNGEVAGSEYFTENIQVLYDIPDNPLVKLQSSIRLIRENLMDYERYLNRYHSDLEKKITQIRDFKKKDQKIKENKDRLRDVQKDLEIKTEIRRKAGEELSKLEIIEEVFVSSEIFDSITRYDKELMTLKEKRKKLKQVGLGSGTPKFRKQVQEFNTVNGNIKSILSALKYYSEVFSGEQLTFLKNAEKKLNELYSPQSIDTKTIEKWIGYIKETITQLEEDPINEEFIEEEKQFEVINKIMEVLRGYLTLEMSIPGTNANGIFPFYRELEEFSKKIEPKISRKKDLSNVVTELKKLSINLDDLKVKRELIPDVDEKQMYAYGQIEKEISKLENVLTDLRVKALTHEQILNSFSEDEILEILKNPGKREEYQRTKSEVKNLCEEIKKLEQQEHTLKARIEDLGVVELPTTYDESWLQEEYNNCSNLIPKIIKWKKSLDPVDFRRANSEVSYDQEKDFFDALSEYFAEILQKVFFEKKSWVVEKVDLANKQYIVKDRKPIKFIQMGTGHNALNSILARIKQKFGERKKIILVDEIGHMDKDNIKILIEEIKNQVKNGETILALITIADNFVSEVTWDPITI